MSGRCETTGGNLERRVVCGWRGVEEQSRWKGGRTCANGKQAGEGQGQGEESLDFCCFDFCSYCHECRRCAASDNHHYLFEEEEIECCQRFDDAREHGTQEVCYRTCSREASAYHEDDDVL